jgi:hypothetical protein
MTARNNDGDIQFLEALYIAYTLFLQAKVWAMILGWTTIGADDVSFRYGFWSMMAFSVLAEVVRWSSAMPIPFRQDFFITRLILQGVFLYLWLVPRMVLYIQSFFRTSFSLPSGFDALCMAAIILFVIHDLSRALHETYALKRRPIRPLGRRRL